MTRSEINENIIFIDKLETVLTPMKLKGEALHNDIRASHVSTNDFSERN